MGLSDVSCRNFTTERPHVCLRALQVAFAAHEDEDKDNAMEPIGLKEAIGALRKELSESIITAADEKLRFEVGEITLECQVEVERTDELSGGIKFWVVEFGAKDSLSSTHTHTITIPLRPLTQQGEPVLTGSDSIPE